MEEIDKKDFLIGISTAAYHIEGNLIHSDWWEFEKEFFKSNPEMMSGPSVDYWNRWRQDNEYLSELGTNVYRTSIDWSRIQPQKDKFDEEAIEEYRKQFADLKQRNIKLTLTLFHYVSPKWFADLGGFSKKENLIYFQKFAERVLEEYRDYINILTPINEMMLYTILSYIAGHFPPQSRSVVLFIKTMRNLIRSHFLVAEIIESQGYPFKLSSAEHYRQFKYFNAPFVRNTIGKFNNYLFDKAVTKSLKNNVFAFPFGFGLKKVTTRPYHKLDYVGMQIYPRIELKVYRKKRFFGLTPVKFSTFAEAIYSSKFTPEDILFALEDFHETFKTDILITEAGIDTKDDAEREIMLSQSKEKLHEARQKGIPVYGFMHFTLFDCFEWTSNFGPTFGLIKVDRTTQQRTKRPSFDTFQRVAKELTS